MDKLFDWIKSLPQWGKILLAVIVVLGLGGGIVYSFLPKKEAVSEEDTPRASIVQEMPDAEVETDNSSRLKSYISGTPSSVNTQDYWDSLGNEEEGVGDGGLIVSGTSSGSSRGNGSGRYSGEYLDPGEYSELEIYYIKNNIKSRAVIDQEHAQKRAENARLQASASTSSSQSTMTQAQKDSLYFARMEKAYEMAAKYSQPAQSQQAAAPEPEPEPELRHIDLSDQNQNVEASYVDINAFSDDGIISSLDEPTSGGVIHYNDAKVKSSPVKCTFLSTEKLVSGQRVILRLMQDLVLADGTLIPVNTHITGTCKTGNRLQITVNAIHYGGKMYQTNIIAYDNDGTEGIYCPVLETKKTKQSSKRVAGATAGGAASAVLGALTGNPYLTRIASTSMNEVTRAIEDNGTISINVVSGYVFYLLESN